jgi:hypothetical protein
MIPKKYIPYISKNIMYDISKNMVYDISKKWGARSVEQIDGIPSIYFFREVLLLGQGCFQLVGINSI